MIRKYHNHKLQTTPWHREEEPLNHHETPGRQIKQSNQPSLPHQDDCNTRMDIKQRTTKHRTITNFHNADLSNNCDSLVTIELFKLYRKIYESLRYFHNGHYSV